MKKPNIRLPKVSKQDVKRCLQKGKDSFRTRAFRAGGYSVAATAIVLAIAIAFNVLAGALPVQYTQLDITSNGRYSLSSETKQILSNLESEVTIYWLVQSGQEDSTLSLLLDQYESRSDLLTVQKKDPDVYPTFAQQYTSETVSNNSLIVVSGDQSRYVAYSDLYEYDYSNYYTTGTYDINFTGESELTSAISYVLSDDLPKLYVLTGHGEDTLSSDFESAVEHENIEVEELSLLTSESVPEDADAVLIYNPDSDISAEEAEMLLEYLQAGGNLLLIADPPEDGSLENLEGLMAEYGVSAVEGVVIEGDQSHYAWGTPYYLLPDYGTHDITEPLSEEGYYVLLPLAQGLLVSDDLRDGLTVTELLTTSDSAYSKTAGYSITTYEKEDGDIDGPFALAVAVTDTVDDETETKLVWVSSGSLLDDQTNSQVSGGNQDFFLNALNWMFDQEDSISIHAKSISYSYLTIDSATSSLLTVIVVAIIPLIYLGAGITVWLRRKRR